MSTNAKRSDLPNRWNARECGGRGLYNARRAPVPLTGERVANDAVVVFGCIWLAPAKYNQIQSGGGGFPNTLANPQRRGAKFAALLSNLAHRYKELGRPA
eukprot:scaffold9813_cov56-Phaeocystis_antarctica.AAC.2